MSKQIHYVRIVDGVTSFECQDATAKCHSYPVCDCEWWQDDHSAEYGKGHEMVHHERCILQGWFDADGAIYTGPDADDMTDNMVPRHLTRAGFITHDWEDEWVEFEFKDVTP